MAINQEQYDELVMNIIVEGGNACTLAGAIQEARREYRLSGDPPEEVRKRFY